MAGVLRHVEAVERRSSPTLMAGAAIMSTVIRLMATGASLHLLVAGDRDGDLLLECDGAIPISLLCTVLGEDRVVG